MNKYSKSVLPLVKRSFSTDLIPPIRQQNLPDINLGWNMAAHFTKEREVEFSPTSLPLNNLFSQTRLTSVLKDYVESIETNDESQLRDVVEHSMADKLVKKVRDLNEKSQLKIVVENFMGHKTKFHYLGF